MATIQDLEKKLSEQDSKIEVLMAALSDANARLGAAKPTTKFYDKSPQKFWTKAPRYVGDKYVTASPEAPVVITFPDSVKIAVRDDGVTPVDGTLVPFVSDKPPVEKAVKPFAEIRRGPKDQTGAADPSGRPSDTDPANR